MRLPILSGETPHAQRHPHPRPRLRARGQHRHRPAYPGVLSEPRAHDSGGVPQTRLVRARRPARLLPEVRLEPGRHHALPDRHRRPQLRLRLVARARADRPRRCRCEGGGCRELCAHLFPQLGRHRRDLPAGVPDTPVRGVQDRRRSRDRRRSGSRPWREALPSIVSAGSRCEIVS